MELPDLRVCGRAEPARGRYEIPGGGFGGRERVDLSDHAARRRELGAGTQQHDAGGRERQWSEDVELSDDRYSERHVAGGAGVGFCAEGDSVEHIRDDARFLHVVAGPGG